MRRKRKPITERQWQRTMHKLCMILFGAIAEDGDQEAERLLESVEPDGHRMAGYARYCRRGPLALLNAPSQGTICLTLNPQLSTLNIHDRTT